MDNFHFLRKKLGIDFIIFRKNIHNFIGKFEKVRKKIVTFGVKFIIF